MPVMSVANVSHLNRVLHAFTRFHAMDMPPGRNRCEAPRKAKPASALKQGRIALQNCVDE
jgi:hypothetical protein